MQHPTGFLNSSWLVSMHAIATNLEGPEMDRVWPSQEKVEQAYSDLVAWDQWLGANRRAMAADELQLHELTLRWAKGVVKLWRINLALPDGPPFRALNSKP